MWQSGHVGVRSGGMTKFALLVITGTAVILFKFFFFTLLHAFKYLTSLHSQAFSDSLKSPYIQIYFQEFWH